MRIFSSVCIEKLEEKYSEIENVERKIIECKKRSKEKSSNVKKDRKKNHRM